MVLAEGRRCGFDSHDVSWAPEPRPEVRFLGRYPFSAPTDPPCDLMAHRRFADARGIMWDVWEVQPSYAERRVAERDRRRTRRPGTDRRRVADPTRVRISTQLTQGWLAFQSEGEKRRLVPVPNKWEACDDAALEQLLAKAVPVGKPRRLIE